MWLRADQAWVDRHPLAPFVPELAVETVPHCSGLFEACTKQVQDFSKFQPFRPLVLWFPCRAWEPDALVGPCLLRAGGRLSPCLPQPRGYNRRFMSEPLDTITKTRR